MQFPSSRLFLHREKGRSQFRLYRLCLGVIRAGHSHGVCVTTHQLFLGHGEGTALCHHADGTAQGLQVFL